MKNLIILLFVVFAVACNKENSPQIQKKSGLKEQTAQFSDDNGQNIYKSGGISVRDLMNLVIRNQGRYEDASKSEIETFTKDSIMPILSRVDFRGITSDPVFIEALKIPADEWTPELSAQVINLLESYGMIIPAPQGGEGFEPNYPCTSIYNTTVSGLYVHYLVDMANAGTQSNWIVGSMMAAMATYDYIVGLSNAQKAWCKCMKVTYGSSPC